MAGSDDADAEPLAGRHRRHGRREAGGGRDGQGPAASAGAADPDDGEGPDEDEMNAVSRLMGFLRGDEGDPPEGSPPA